MTSREQSLADVKAVFRAILHRAAVTDQELIDKAVDDAAAEALAALRVAYQRALPPHPTVTAARGIFGVK